MQVDAPARPLKRKRTTSIVSFRSASSRRSRRSYAMAIHSSNLFPPIAKVVLRYSEVITANPASGGLILNVFSANGAFDPNITLTGGQPRGFDQWMAIYNHYCVVASRLRIVTTSQAAPDNVVMITLSGSTTALGTALDELPSCPYTTIGNMPGKFFGGHEIRTPWYSMRKMFKVKDIVAKDSLCGDASSNPADQQYYHVNVGSVGAVDPPSVSFFVIVEYNIVFFEPKIPGTSS